MPETGPCPETHPWPFDRGTRCCKSALREDPSSGGGCPADPARPVLGFSDPVGCCAGSDFVDCPESPEGSCSSEDSESKTLFSKKKKTFKYS